MRQLIDNVIAAHGGLERWHRVNAVSATFHPAGLALQLRGQSAFSDRPSHVTVDTHEQRVSIDPFLAPDHIGLYTPDRTAIMTADGRALDALRDPRSSFRPEGAWSDLQLIYFVGHALWTYFNLPFLLARNDIGLEEIEPWTEGSETWRAVKVTFPRSIATLCPEQILYFDDRGLIRREDYAVEVSGTDPVAHYVDGHRVFDGIVFPTKRRIYPKLPDGSPHRDVVIMSADLGDYQLS